MAETVRIGFHMGNALLTVAETYHTLMATMLEMVQNPIDANATWIRVTVNQKTRNIIIHDNGDGVSKQDFNKALEEICASKKPKGKYGRFGKGIVSPFGKCERYTVTSLDRPHSRGFLEWTFDTKELMSKVKAEDMVIPVTAREDLCTDVLKPRHGETAVNWRTQIRIKNYSRDRVISKINLDELDRQIARRYGKELRKRQIDITLTVVDEKGRESSRRVRANTYNGYPLEEFALANDAGGQTTFRMYYVGSGGRGVDLGEQDDPFRFEWERFEKAHRHLLPADIRSALWKFEGEILSSRAKLHPDREQFEEDDALVGLCSAIAQWHKEVGQPYLDDLKEEGKEQLYKETWLETLRNFETMLRNPEFAALNDIIGSFRRGTIGEGHVMLPPSRIAGIQDVATTSIDGGGGRNKDDAINGVTRPPQPPKGGDEDEETGGKKPHKKHRPFTASGDGRQRRTVVINDSLGLQILCEPAVDSDKLYGLDMRNGILRINTRHRQWVQCEDMGSTEMLMKFERIILIEALTLAASNPHWREVQELYAEDVRKAHIFTLIQEAKNLPPAPAKKQPAAAIG